LIGRRVAALARERGHEVIGFTRYPERGGPECRRFNTEEVPDVTGCDAILNLAGESVAGLWTPAKRRAIRLSRVLGTRRIVEAIARTNEPPSVLVSGSATGIYGDAGDAVIDETAAHGRGFLAEVCEDWEAEAIEAGEAGARVALLRTGMVLAREGGALAAMLPVFRLGLGGKLGSGRQWVPWIHIEDEAALALAAVENQTIRGPVNATAPNPARNADFTRTLAETLGRPAFLKVPAFALRAAAGGFSAELLGSRRIVPDAAAKAGFAFRFPTIEGALADLLRRA
jgi:uncharacterized protein (TIGR01777 family)